MAFYGFDQQGNPEKKAGSEKRRPGNQRTCGILIKGAGYEACIV
jgi:hypothetical protein